jgi:chromosome segregation ATPase
MMSTLKRALAGLGLVPAGQLDRAEEQTRQLTERLRSLEDRIVKLKADTDTWKQRHEEVAVKLRECREQAAQAAADAERMRAGAEHAKTKANEWKGRAEALSAEKRDLRARLEDVQRAAITSREYVMATEAKLDVIEAALQVLDSRTREAALTKP